MTAQGIRTVAALELRQRSRTSRWPVVLGVWFTLIGAITTLTWLAVNDSDFEQGPALYDVTTFFVLGFGMLVMPSLTATSINGDRDQGVLATLQTTLLTPGDIVLGKLAASWLVSVVFLASVLPFLLWAWVAGGISVGQVLRSLLVLVIVLAVVCAIGLMFSTLVARPVASAVLTYLTVAALVFGTAIVFALSLTLVTEERTVTVYGVPESYWESHQEPVLPPTEGTSPMPGPSAEPTMPTEPTAKDCVRYTRTQQVNHTERVWWLLPLNPFVTVADAAPGRGTDDELLASFRPMQWISIGARAARAGGDDGVRQECWFGSNAGPTRDEPPAQGGPVWPFGLAALVLLGVGATTVAVRRTRTPIRRLPNGTRIA